MRRPGDLSRFVASALIVALVPFAFVSLLPKIVAVTVHSTVVATRDALRAIWNEPRPVNRRRSPGVSGGSSLPLRPGLLPVTFQAGRRLH